MTGLASMMARVERLESLQRDAARGSAARDWPPEALFEVACDTAAGLAYREAYPAAAHFVDGFFAAICRDVEA